jgi:nickel-dependent lactate racemase
MAADIVNQTYRGFLMKEFPIPDNMRVYIAESISPDQADAFSLADDIVYVGQKHLVDLVRPDIRITIAFTDATRACPDKQLIAFLLDQLTDLGVEPANITLLCATGLHRPISQTELLKKLGARAVEEIRVVNHYALDPAELAELGEINSRPVVTNRRCVETDLLLATGVVEPHQYAGYSGGAKTVAIGCGGEATIQATHGAAMLDEPGTRLGVIKGNPFQRFVRQAGEKIGLAYVVNVVLDEHGEMLAAAAGEPGVVHDHLVEQARRVYEVPVERPAHLALAGVNAVKAVNLYQASRAATYLALADHTPLLPGAPILLPASISEGAGEGTGEQRFYEILSQAESPAQLITELRQTGFPAGAQRAYILAQVLAQHPVIVVGAEYPDVARTCHMHAVPDIESGLALSEELARRHFDLPAPKPLDFLVVTQALLTLPRLLESA